MLCPECKGEWKIVRKPILIGPKRRVCSVCGYMDTRPSWVNEEYVGPPEYKETQGFKDHEEKAGWAELMFEQNIMPCCNKPVSEVGFMEGPSGGMCMNITCGGCGQRWNISPSIGFIEKI